MLEKCQKYVNNLEMWIEYVKNSTKTLNQYVRKGIKTNNSRLNIVWIQQKISKINIKPLQLRKLSQENIVDVSIFL